MALVAKTFFFVVVLVVLLAPIDAILILIFNFIINTFCRFNIKLCNNFNLVQCLPLTKNRNQIKKKNIWSICVFVLVNLLKIAGFCNWLQTKHRIAGQWKQVYWILFALFEMKSIMIIANTLSITCNHTIQFHSIQFNYDSIHWRIWFMQITWLSKNAIYEYKVSYHQNQLKWIEVAVGCV